MENLTDETKKNNEENPLRKWIVILGALAFVFLCTTIYFAFFAAPSFNTRYRSYCTPCKLLLRTDT